MPLPRALFRSLAILRTNLPAPETLLTEVSGSGVPLGHWRCTATGSVALRGRSEARLLCVLETYVNGVLQYGTRTGVYGAGLRYGKGIGELGEGLPYCPMQTPQHQMLLRRKPRAAFAIPHQPSNLPSAGFSDINISSSCRGLRCSSSSSSATVTQPVHHQDTAPSPFARKLVKTKTVDGSPTAPGAGEELVDLEYTIPPLDLGTKEMALRIGPGRGMLAFFADHQEVPLPPNHRFPMNKYRRMRSALLQDGSLDSSLAMHPAPFVAKQDLLRVHCPEYLKKIETGGLSPLEERAIGFPWSLHSVRRAMASCGGTVAATHAVLLGLWRVAGTMAGGTHHAFRDRGEGFCIYNDIAVASAMALSEYPEQCNKDRPILVVDLDVHQGNGTAAIFEGSETVITFSSHGANNYPWRSKTKSTYDVELPDATGDDEFLAMLQQWLPHLFDKHKPGLVFFQAGVDGLREDSFGRLSLTHDGLLRRNHLVYSLCIAHSIPLVITMGGGYSRPPDASIRAHADVYRTAAYRFGSVHR